MSYQAVAWALDIPRLRPAAKLVLVALAERANEKGGSCHPGFTELTRRASTSRWRINEAIHELESIGAIQVHRSRSADGKRRAPNEYQLAVGQQIEVPKKPSKPAAKQGTTLVPVENQGGSPGGTVTFTEPPVNPHAILTYRRAFPEKPRDDELTRCDESPPELPRQAMIAVARATSVEPNHAQSIVSNHRNGTSEDTRGDDIEPRTSKKPHGKRSRTSSQLSLFTKKME
jgi:hypothetical protein